MDLKGFSIAGVETCIEVPSLRLVLDLGRCSRTAINQPLILVSHGHLDHIGAIAQHAARRAMMKMGESVYLVPRVVAHHAEALFNAAGALDGHPIPRRVVPMSPGEDFPLGKGRWVRPFETFHRVPSQGYTIWEKRHRLREDLRGAPAPKLGELRKQGVTVDEPYDAPLLSFTGDTRVEALERNPELQSTETLVIEATFLDDVVSLPDAREMGHIHLSELLDRADLLPKRDVVLTHFSARYTEADISRILGARLPDDLRERVRVVGGCVPT
jgi:ribonuclease Z